MMKHWMADVVACSDGTEVSAKAIRKLEEYKIPLRSEPIRSLEGANGELARIVFESGPEIPRIGLFFSTGCGGPASEWEHGIPRVESLRYSITFQNVFAASPEGAQA